MKNHTCMYHLGLRTAVRCRHRWLCTPGVGRGAVLEQCAQRHRTDFSKVSSTRLFFLICSDTANSPKKPTQCELSLYGWYMLFTVICSVSPFACSSVPQGSEPWQQLRSILLLILGIFLHR